MLDAEAPSSTSTNSTTRARMTRKIRPRTFMSHLPDLQVPRDVGQRLDNDRSQHREHYRQEQTLNHVLVSLPAGWHTSVSRLPTNSVSNSLTISTARST